MGIIIKSKSGTIGHVDRVIGTKLLCTKCDPEYNLLTKEAQFLISSVNAERIGYIEYWDLKRIR
jgi:hypothetical protein